MPAQTMQPALPAKQTKLPTIPTVTKCPENESQEDKDCGAEGEPTWTSSLWSIRRKQKSKKMCLNFIS